MLVVTVNGTFIANYSNRYRSDTFTHQKFKSMNASFKKMDEEMTTNNDIVILGSVNGSKRTTIRL